jgi:hypothetical protein
MHSDEELSFAYKYPFSREAKTVIGAQSVTGQNLDVFLEQAKTRLEEAFSKGKLEYKNLRYGKLDYVIGYAYARMLVSGLGSRAGISKYAAAEASRSKDAIESGDADEIMHLSGELGLDVTRDKADFKIGFPQFLKYMSSTPEFSLVNFKLHGGFVVLDRHQVADLLRNAMLREILKGLPIKLAEMPARITAFSKTIKLPIASIRPATKGGGSAWIDKLLDTPIPDVRHRVVNLVLAPYLVNTKGVSEEEAFKVISNYIERCKELDPNTKVNDSYIRYQCAYARKRGLKPLSLTRARELLGGLVDLEQEKKVINK